MSFAFTPKFEIMTSDPAKASELTERLKVVLFDELDESGFDYREIHDDEVGPGDSLPGFRSDDPETSRKAALDHYPRAKTQRHQALLAVARSEGGATYADVERITGINGIWKRLSELEQGGWIFPAGTRLIEETGSEGQVYIVTDKGARYVEHKEGLPV